jgi:hypothetical protein
MYKSKSILSVVPLSKQQYLNKRVYTAKYNHSFLNGTTSLYLDINFIKK